MFRVLRGGDETSLALPVVLPWFAPAREGLAAMWARERIADWTSDIRDGPPDSVEALRRRITETALAAGVVSAVTSMECLEEDAREEGTGTR